jgi:hypothetical protein
VTVGDQHARQGTADITTTRDQNPHDSPRYIDESTHRVTYIIANDRHEMPPKIENLPADHIDPGSDDNHCRAIKQNQEHMYNESILVV